MCKEKKTCKKHFLRRNERKKNKSGDKHVTHSEKLSIIVKSASKLVLISE